MPSRPALVAALLLLVAILSGCGDQRPPAAAPLVPARVQPGDFLAEATAVRSLTGGSGFAITVRVPAGEPGCATRVRARYDTFENRLHHVTTLVRSSADGCAGSAERTVALRVPVRGHDLVLNNEAWKPGPGDTWVRCGGLGCHPPRDRCDEVWTDAVAADVELEPERRIETLACDAGPDGGLVVDVDAVVTGCQSVDGSTPPTACAGTGTHTRWFAQLDDERAWHVVASGTAAGCADVLAVEPEFPTRLCEGLPAAEPGEWSSPARASSAFGHGRGSRGA